MLKHLNSYRIAVILSSLSLGFGILREFLIVGLLGFTANNDKLQLYLSIFYTIGLSIDAMRLACLNLYNQYSLPRILFSASVIGLPFSILVGTCMSYATGGLNLTILMITILGSYLNLMATLLITYKQRSNTFLAAQIINVMPNFILIPGILLWYWLSKQNLIFSIIMLTSMIPVAQCVLLLLLPNKTPVILQKKRISFIASIIIFLRHFAAMVGEQLFQMIIRSAFYHYGVGYLSVFAMTIRIYSAARFILIDSFIGSKLASWQKNPNQSEPYFAKLINLTMVSLLIACTALIISIHPSSQLIYCSIQMGVILLLGFYFSTLVRVIYFKINHHEINPALVTRFAAYELICALITLLLTIQLNYPILSLLWVGYIAKPFVQLLLLRKRYHGLATG